MDRTSVKESMRRLALFEGLGEGDLDQLVDLSRQQHLAPGEVLMREGEPGDTMYVIVDGALEVVKGRGNQEHRLAVRSRGEVVGEMALVEHTPRTATVRALAETELLVIGRAAFATLLSCSATAAPTILSTVASRLRSTESMLMHQAKLAALGTMAAGLAHELNNPAAAIRRSADHLRKAVDAMDAATLELASAALDETEVAEFAALRRGDGVVPAERATATRREGQIEAWLEGVGVEDAWVHAAPLAAAGWSAGLLDTRLTHFAANRRGVVAHWLAARAATAELLEEAHLSADAISALVAAVKRYTYLDQAPVQDVDVHEGLETTLTVMRHKLRDGIDVVREYGERMPRIEAHGSELNQVWTNLVDNAIDAMRGRGSITLRTSASDRDVTVEVHDDGPGIPEEVQARLFEPFFTTKGVGEGTGLGLHIAYTIVVDRHRGRIDVRSAPGDTTFRVTLPRAIASD